MVFSSRGRGALTPIARKVASHEPILIDQRQQQRRPAQAEESSNGAQAEAQAEADQLLTRERLTAQAELGTMRIARDFHQAEARARAAQLERERCDAEAERDAARSARELARARAEQLERVRAILQHKPWVWVGDNFVGVGQVAFNAPAGARPYLFQVRAARSREMTCHTRGSRRSPTNEEERPYLFPRWRSR